MLYASAQDSGAASPLLDELALARRDKRSTAARLGITTMREPWPRFGHFSLFGQESGRRLNTKWLI